MVTNVNYVLTYNFVWMSIIVQCIYSFDISPGVYAIVLNHFWNVGLGKRQRKVALGGGTLTQVLELGVWHYAYLKWLAKANKWIKSPKEPPPCISSQFQFWCYWHQQHILLYKSRLEFPFYNKGFLHYFFFWEHNIYYLVKNKRRLITLSFFLINIFHSYHF